MVSKRNLREILMLLPFCTFLFKDISFGSTLTFFIELYKLIVLFYYIYIYKIRKSDFNLLVGFSCVYELSYLIPAFFNSEMTIRTFYLWVKEFYTVVALMVILSRLLREDYLRTIKNVYRMLASVIILHVFLVSTVGCAILGIRTRFGDSFTVAVILMLVYKELARERWRVLILFS